MLKVKIIYFLLFAILLKAENNIKWRVEIVKKAKEYLGCKRFVDCSGFVRLILKKTGNNYIEKRIHKYTGRNRNGVKLIFMVIAREGGIYRNYRYVRIGDVIFFNNTYDRNKNRRLDDRFTHIAIVTGIDRNGTIEYIHSGNRGIERGYMNLRYRHKHKLRNKVINSYLRRKRKRESRGTKYLAGELFYAFGRIRFER